MYILHTGDHSTSQSLRIIAQIPKKKGKVINIIKIDNSNAAFAEIYRIYRCLFYKKIYSKIHKLENFKKLNKSVIISRL